MKNGFSALTSREIFPVALELLSHYLKARVGTEVNLALSEPDL